LCFEVWNTPTESISVRRPNYKFNVNSRGILDFLRATEGSRQRESISQEFHDNITDVLDKYKDATDSAVLMVDWSQARNKVQLTLKINGLSRLTSEKTMVLAFDFLVRGWRTPRLHHVGRHRLQRQSPEGPGHVPEPR
jgi:hypothetical protein